MKLLSFIILQPAIFCTAWFLHYAVEMRRPLTYSLVSMAVMDSLWLLNNVLFPAPVVLINALCFPICYILLPLFYAGPAGRVRAIGVQMLLSTLQFLLCIIMDYLLRRFAAPLGLDLASFYDPNSSSYALLSLGLNVINILAMFVTARILNRLLSSVEEGKSLLWFLTIPLTQLILITMLTNLYFYGDASDSAPLLMGLGVLMCIGSDIACLFGFRKYKRMQLAGKKLEEARRQLQLQAEHYRDLQEDILKINKIRHDLKNQLQAAIYLIKQGNAREADGQLELLNQELSRKVGSQYCENLMVDAVLTEKAKRCENQKIRLLVSAPVPRQMDIESAYLCSAFSNLLDNAIAGTLESDSPAGPIDLSCDIQGAYLTISCKNPGNKPGGKKNTQLLRTHGLGLDILEEISREYSGNFHTEWDHGIFRANLSLKI